MTVFLRCKQILATKGESRPMKIRVADIVEESIVDGEGIRLAVFFQGCPHNCPGCHNPATHSFTGGQDMECDDILNKLTDNPLHSGLTLTGGEPFAQAKSAAILARAAHEKGYSVWCYTGYTVEELEAKHTADTDELLANIDVLVDGPYIEAERDLSLRFRGSRNQRLLDMKSRGHGATPLYE